MNKYFRLLLFSYETNLSYLNNAYLLYFQYYFLILILINLSRKAELLAVIDCALKESVVEFIFHGGINIIHN